MHQGKNQQSITEYHVCSECIYRISVPSSFDMRKWECACIKKRDEVNRSGGLTRCPIFKENPDVA